jgi:hypothetical protein
MNPSEWAVALPASKMVKAMQAGARHSARPNRTKNLFHRWNHRFDDVIVDFYLSDQILRIGGIIAFLDMGMNSVRTAANFILNNPMR